MSFAIRIHCWAVAWIKPASGSITSGSQARNVLRWLLLVDHAGAVRPGHGECGLDGPGGGRHGYRKELLVGQSTDAGAGNGFTQRRNHPLGPGWSGDRLRLLDDSMERSGERCHYRPIVCVQLSLEHRFPCRKATQTPRL